jgi:hypothetical protein
LGLGSLNAIDVDASRADFATDLAMLNGRFAALD